MYKYGFEIHPISQIYSEYKNQEKYRRAKENQEAHKKEIAKSLKYYIKMRTTFVTLAIASLLFINSTDARVLNKRQATPPPSNPIGNPINTVTGSITGLTASGTGAATGGPVAALAGISGTLTGASGAATGLTGSAGGLTSVLGGGGGGGGGGGKAQEAKRRRKRGLAPVRKLVARNGPVGGPSSGKVNGQAQPAGQTPAGGKSAAASSGGAGAGVPVVGGLLGGLPLVGGLLG
ncbi:hypothetical protein BD770DRAFT_412098 [Pilaira anomala]|nr:hypothetical protein BD770DRAFT_412098 [Pilaira anomala]